MLLADALNAIHSEMIGLRVYLESDLHIGTGSGGSAWTDRAVIRDSEGLPLIPGSHLKGILRDNAERLCDISGAFACRAPRAENMCPRPGQSGLCPVCQLFGGPRIQSSLLFSDLTLVDRFYEPTLLTRIRNSVSLDRWRRTAKEGRLFTTEVVPGGMTFEGTIQVTRNLSSTERTLLRRSVRLAERLGGSKSVGLGQISITMEEDNR